MQAARTSLSATRTPLPLTRIQATHVDYTEGKPVPNLCKDCRWLRIENSVWRLFDRRPSKYELSFSRCGKYSRLDLVSGEKNYEYTEIARKYTCTGNGFEPRPEDEPIGTF